MNVQYCTWAGCSASDFWVEKRAALSGHRCWQAAQKQPKSSPKAAQKQPKSSPKAAQKQPEMQPEMQPEKQPEKQTSVDGWACYFIIGERFEQ
jgi:hypothetical protein